MARITYSNLMSLDGYIADRDGNFDWAEPVGEVHEAVNDDARSAGTMALGRRVYDVLRAWDDIDPEGEPGPMTEFAAIWHASDKLVYSRSLTSLEAPRTTLAREFDPEALRAFADAADRDVSIGGAELAAQAFAAGVVDDVVTWVFPVTVGGGTPAFPPDARVGLELVAERRLAGGVVELRYTAR